MRDEVAILISSERCDNSIIELMYNGDHFFLHEDALWDYKGEIGLKKLNKSDDDYKYKICDLVKDIVSFFNTEGGYIIFGVDDSSKKIIGLSEEFPLDDICSRLKTDTNEEIPFTYYKQTVKDFLLGVLFIPPRVANQAPIAFKANSKKSSKGRNCYKQNDIYYRNGDSSEPAIGDALMRLVSGQKIGSIAKIVDHNLPVRDKSFTQFIGRRAELDKLWRWLLDTFNNTRLVAGVGGVGKTTLVREFVEEVVNQSPGNIERIIWLSAKKNNFDAFYNSLYSIESSYENRFSSENDLYKKILISCGYIESDFDEEWSRSRYLIELNAALNVTPSLVVVDDLDSLEHDTQLDIFSNLSLVFHGLSISGGNSSRCIATARLRLGASVSQYHELRGFSEGDFYAFLKHAYNQYNIKFELTRGSKLFKNFHRFSLGSPLFSSSILRLVAGGVALDKALNYWENAEGEDVRDFAFKKEIDQLAPGQLRVLYALLLLSPCSLEELVAVTGIAERTMVTEIGRLSDYHLLERDPSVTSGGREFSAPSNSSLLYDLVKPKIDDPRRIEKRSKEIRAEKRARVEEVSIAIGRIVSFWKLEEYEKAFEYIDKLKSKSGAAGLQRDLECMYGRACLRLSPPELDKADAAFRRAREKSCDRVELLPLWIECRQLKGDWAGVIELCEKALDEKIDAQRFADIGHAYFNLGTDRYSAGEIQGAVDTYVKGGQVLNAAIGAHELSDYFQSVNTRRKECFIEAIRIAQENSHGLKDVLNVYEIAWSAFECFVRNPYVLNILADSSVKWGEFVTKIRKTSKGDFSKIDTLVGRQSNVLEILENHDWSYRDLILKTRISVEKLIGYREIMHDALNDSL